MIFRFGNISSLQFFQLLRFSVFLLIGIIFTKTGLEKTEIGQYELILFISGAVSFFWLNGLIQGLLPVFQETDEKSPQLFNIFVLLSVFTVFVGGFLVFFGKPFSNVFLDHPEIPFLKYLLAYLFFSVPASLVEYIYLLKDKARSMVWYGCISFSLMLVLVSAPVVFGFTVRYALGGLVAASAIRYAWLIVLLLKYSAWRLSFSFLAEHLKLSAPLIISSFLSGSAQYIDGFIVSSRFDEQTFAVFRYGAREFPLVILLANAFSSAMIPRFQEKKRPEAALQEIKMYSTRLMHFLFPLSAIMLSVTHWLFPIVFNTGFRDSATIFNIYLLLITSRLIFPQTILIGLKKTNAIAMASFLEITLNISLSLWFVKLWGIPGIAYATIVAYLFEKIFLASYLVKKTGISPRKYLNISLHMVYSLLLMVVFYYIEFVIY